MWERLGGILLIAQWYLIQICAGMYLLIILKVAFAV